MKIPETLVTTITGAQKVALFTHIHPDGDALGSMLAMADILKRLGKDVFCYLEEPSPVLFDFLPGIKQTSTSLDELRNFCEGGSDVAGLSLDCGDSQRLGSNQDVILSITPFLAIDHHRTHQDFGYARWVNPDASSTGEMVYELMTALGASLSHEVALNLYVAMATDTGSFRYECTTSQTMRIAAELLDYGVSPANIYDHLYNSSTTERILLMQKVLASLQMFSNEEIAVITLRKEIIAETGAGVEDSEGFVDIPRSIRSVKVVAFIKEKEDSSISVSLRAKGECDVAAVACVFGGGGHRNASGFRFSTATVEGVTASVVAEVTRQLALQ